MAFGGGYSEIVFNNQIDKFVFVWDQSVGKASESGIHFVTTFHRKVKEPGKLIKGKFPFLYSDEEVQTVFSLPSLVS